MRSLSILLLGLLALALPATSTLTAAPANQNGNDTCDELMQDWQQALANLQAAACAVEEAADVWLGAWYDMNACLVPDSACSQEEITRLSQIVNQAQAVLDAAYVTRDLAVEAAEEILAKIIANSCEVDLFQLSLAFAAASRCNN